MFHGAFSMLQCIWYKQHEIKSDPLINTNKHQWTWIKTCFQFLKIFVQSYWGQCQTTFYHLWSEAHIMMLPAFFKWAEDLRDYPYLLLCLRTWGCVEMSIWEVSGWSELFRWLNVVSGSKYFVLCQELEHLNVTWASERDVPETVDMWRHRKLSSAHLWWWRQDKWRWRVTARRRGLCYFVQHNQVKVICECISTLKLHPCWSCMNKTLAV